MCMQKPDPDKVEKPPFNPIKQYMNDLDVMEEMDEEEEASLRGNTKPIEIGMIVYDRQLGVCQVKTMSPDSQWATVWSQEKSNLVLPTCEKPPSWFPILMDSNRE